MNPTASTPLLSLHQLSLYNTGRMSPEQIIAAFAARRQQLDRIVADLAAEKPKSRAQHHLVVGQRGMGKTMLLARIAAELRTDSKLSARFIPLVFAEEQYAVDRLSKFWLNCLDSLADARELTNDTAGVDEIDAIVKDLTEAGKKAAKDDQPFADEVYDAFARITKAGGQRPVLLVDSLQLVFERLDSGQQHSLRELLMRPGSPILVGASPSPPPESRDYGAAFYDQFKIHYLRPLDESEMRDLLVHLADAAQRDDVRQRVLQHPARLTVLRQLTGGNPRTALTLFFLYAEDFAPSVFGDLEGLLDRVTPLYKARFEELTPQQQVVASAIANNWDPVTAAALATATGLAASTISAQLDRLEKTGVVERTELFGETRIGYQLAERFFNIWFLMRSASRRQRREVEFLTRFLETFYEEADRSRLARQLMSEDHFTPDRYVWSRAVADSLSEPETAEELRRHTELTALREEACEARERLRQLIDFQSLPPATLAFDDLRKKLISLVPDNAEIAPEDFAKCVLSDRAMFISGEREQLAARSSKLDSAEIKSLAEATGKSRSSDTQRYSEGAVAWFSQRLTSGQIRGFKDADDWNRAFNQANDRQAIQLMLDSLPSDFGSAITDSTFIKISSTVEPNPADSALTWYRWAQALNHKLGRYSLAEAAYRSAINRDPVVDWPWSELGFLLTDRFQRYVEAESTFRQGVSHHPANYHSWYGLGHLLHRHLSRYIEAESAYREAVARNPRFADAWNSLGYLLRDHQRHAEAETAYREAIKSDPNWASPWNGLGSLYAEHLDRPLEAEQAFENALRCDPFDEPALVNRIFLRRDLMGHGSNVDSLMELLRTSSTGECPDNVDLNEALFAAYGSNWGLASAALAKALTTRSNGFSSINTNVWLRASAVLLHLNYGAELLEFLDQRGDTAKLRPWVEALRAHQLGDRRALQNIAPEIRTTAEVFYDGIESRLKKLPEKTRRRPLPKVAKSRAKRVGTRRR